MPERDGEADAGRYLIEAKDAAAAVDDLMRGALPMPVARVGIVGGGTMGRGIATAFLTAGFQVVLHDVGVEALDRSLKAVHENLERNVSKNRMERRAADAALTRLSYQLNIAGLADCDLIIEAVFELIDLKREVFARLDAIARPEAILATNTSYLDVDAIAAATTRPGRVIGLHFFSPAHIMKLLEVVPSRETGPEVLATAMALAPKIQKIAVVAGNCHGFIGNRMMARRRREALNLLMEGATPQQIDEAHTAFGMPMGPFQMSDLAGVDIGWHRDPGRIETVQDALCAAGRLGQKVGKGYYDYDADGQRQPSPEGQAIIADFARSIGGVRRVFIQDDILERTLFPMIDEGAQILAERVARCASDIDVVWVYGYGWPSWRGGPMFWAKRVGLDQVAERLLHHAIPVSGALVRSAAEGDFKG